MFINTQCLNEKTAVIRENHRFKTCLPLFISVKLWGLCTNSNKYAIIALLSIDRKLSLNLTTRIQFRRHEWTNKAVVWTVGWFVQLLGGCFRN